MGSQKGLGAAGQITAGEGVAGASGEPEWGDGLSLIILSPPQHLQEALGLPGARGDDNLEGTPTDKGASETEEGQQEEEEEEEATPTPSSSPSPSPTPEDAITYIREWSLGLPRPPGLHHHFHQNELPFSLPGGTFPLLTAQPIAPQNAMSSGSRPSRTPESPNSQSHKLSPLGHRSLSTALPKSSAAPPECRPQGPHPTCALVGLQWAAWPA